jgi:hypothetical protein
VVDGPGDQALGFKWRYDDPAPGDADEAPELAHRHRPTVQAGQDLEGVLNLCEAGPASSSTDGVSELRAVRVGWQVVPAERGAFFEASAAV